MAWKSLIKRKEYAKIYSAKYYLKHKNDILEYAKEWRKLNKQKVRDTINKWCKNNPEKVKKYNQIKRTRQRKAGYLSVNIIQVVYEDNIKKYGTLTCILCNKPIEFGQDSLEHLQPISRGGTNEYNNLAIAHRKCNAQKTDRTLEEWKMVCRPYPLEGG